MKITQLDVEQVDGKLVKHIMLDFGNDTFMTMTKEAYDKQQAEQSTPIVAGE